MFLRALYVQESARGAVEIAQKHFPGVECKWGNKGLDEIIEDNSILGVAVVLAGQAQVSHSYALYSPSFYNLNIISLSCYIPLYTCARAMFCQGELGSKNKK